MKFRATWQRLFHVVLTTLLIVLCSWQVCNADEITLQLKGGGGFQISGRLRAFDGQKYTIINASFGEMEVDAKRFTCTAGSCPSKKTQPPLRETDLFSDGNIAEITVAGSNTIGNQLMPNLIRAFAAKLKLQVQQIARADPLSMEFRFFNGAGANVARIILHRKGSRSSFSSLKAGKAQIGMSSRPVKNAEVTDLLKAGLGDVRSAASEHIVALDGIVVITSPENPILSMSIDSIAKVFSGQITDWSQFGYPPGLIKVHAPSPSSGTWETFNSLVLKPRGLRLAENTRRTGNHSKQSDWVAADPLSIGVVGIAYQRSAKPLNIKTDCGLITPPVNFAIKTEEYALSRRLYLYTPNQLENRMAARFLDFALSREAQTVIRKAHFVDQSPELISFKEQASRIAFALNAPEKDFKMPLMRELLTDLKNAERSTLTFRFESGSISLDRKSQKDITSLAIAMDDGSLKNKTIKLLGFADSGGLFEANRQLSLSRAQTVRDELIKKLKKQIPPSRLIVRGYGELAPIACNNTPSSRAYNRRVEVWVDQDQ